MMQNLSMHVLDIAANSVRAKATKVSVAVVDSELRNQIKITVSDNGCGMNEEMCRKVQDPFFTSRTTRKIGLGVPFFKELSEQCGGEFSLKSKEGAGTEISASMQRDHWDTPPMGDIGDAVMIAATTDCSVHFIFTYQNDAGCFVFDTDEIKVILGDEVSIADAEIMLWCKDYINQGIAMCGKKEEDL